MSTHYKVIFAAQNLFAQTQSRYDLASLRYFSILLQIPALLGGAVQAS
jgi:hypothetical protein